MTLFHTKHKHTYIGLQRCTDVKRQAKTTTKNGHISSASTSLKGKIHRTNHTRMPEKMLQWSNLIDARFTFVRFYFDFVCGEYR